MELCRIAVSRIAKGSFACNSRGTEESSTKIEGRFGLVCRWTTVFREDEPGDDGETESDRTEEPEYPAL